MNRTIGMLLIGLFLGGGIGFVTAASQNVALEGHDHGNPAHHAGGSHDHAAMAAAAAGPVAHHNHDELLSLPAGPEAPTLAVKVVPDPVSGWNLHIITTRFRFAPEHAGKANAAHEGHAHVYLNGRKVARQYGPWMHIAELPAGDNEIAVTLNANDHRPLAIDGEPLRAVTTVSVE